MVYSDIRKIYNLMKCRRSELHNLCAFCIVFTLFLINALGVIYTSGVSSLFWAGVFMLIFIFLFFLFCQGRKGNKLVKQSRAQCREAYQDLFDYLQANCLKGCDDPKCRELHQVLEKELRWHCEQYPHERWHHEVEKFRTYCQKTKLLEALDD